MPRSTETFLSSAAFSIVENDNGIHLTRIDDSGRRNHSTTSRRIQREGASPLLRGDAFSAGVFLVWEHCAGHERGSPLPVSRMWG
jgi:hypothetical protein